MKQIATGSNALKAGLKEGDELINFSFATGKPEQEASLTIQRGSETIQLRFYPRKSTSLLQIFESAKIPK